MARVAFNELSILIADSNANMRQIVRATLRSFGVRNIEEAEDGASCLEAFQISSPDFLITDIKLPIIDGLEVVRLIRTPETSYNPFIPIIVLTADTEKRHVIAARDSGVTEFLCKPVSPKSLYVRIKSVIETPREFIRTKHFFGPDRRRFVCTNYNGVERRQDGRKEDMDIELTEAES